MLWRCAAAILVLGIWSEATTSTTHVYRSKFTVEQLLHTSFPSRKSNDLDIDPCKAGGFLGDIAIPDPRRDTDWHKDIQDGLQIEEEGLRPPQEPTLPPGVEIDIGGTDFGDTFTPAAVHNGELVRPTPKDPAAEAQKRLQRRRQRNKERQEAQRRQRLQAQAQREAENGTNEEDPYDVMVNDQRRVEERKHRRKSRKRTVKGETYIKTDTPTTKNDAKKEGARRKWRQRRRRRRRPRAATARKERVWEHGVIPYEIESIFDGAKKTLFKQAMRHWENATCVKFVERSPGVAEHSNYIVFTERPCGCCSFVGKRGNGAQAISIGKNCDKFGIVVHELGHVVGFWHEHTRPDRDRHVQIVRDNIMNGQEYNFNKLTSEEVNSLGLSYDYNSIMHYARNTFSKGTYLDTIRPIEQNRSHKRRPEIGQRIQLSDGDIAQTNLLYKCPRCGRTFQENSGVVASPRAAAAAMIANSGERSSAEVTAGGSFGSGGGERCEWRVTATDGERIILNITTLDIAPSENCRSDYLEVHDGYWYRSPSLGRFCYARQLPETIMSTGSRMLITYVSSSRGVNHLGFTATYEAVCGGHVKVNKSGNLESPNFPQEYAPNKECVWFLTAPEKFQVALKFVTFDVENHDSCMYDYVEILDGHSPESTLLGHFCGHKLPPDVHSTGNKMRVKFVSDGSVQKPGFSANYLKEVDECMRLDHGCEHSCINTLGSYECACEIGYELHSDGKNCEVACGGVVDASNGTGTITSPSFPLVYPINKNCTWEIIAPTQYRITINFTHFDLEGNQVYQSECQYDNVEVVSNLRAPEPETHGIFCGSARPPLITSLDNSMRIRFNSDASVQQSGFAAVFFTDIDECADNKGDCQHECHNTLGSYVCTCPNGFTLHHNGRDCKEGGCKYTVSAPEGTLSSPNYPEPYPANKSCLWHLVTTPGHRIRLRFDKFELEPHQVCQYDHVAVYDGASSEARSLGRYCGSKVPNFYLSSTGNQMYIEFTSDGSIQRTGFFARHSTSCGGKLVATNQVQQLYSHAKFGDDNYDGKANCEWSIEPAEGAGSAVRLTFLTFELEFETNCSYDRVEVLGGIDKNIQLGRFCNNSVPGEIISEEAITLMFITDDSISYKGFSAAYEAIDYDGPESGDDLNNRSGGLHRRRIDADTSDEEGEEEEEEEEEDY